jgi:hypothetical protein
MKEYKKTPKYKEYQKEYYQRPEVKERMKEYKKEYYQRPEVKERVKEYRKEYYQRPEVKEYQKEYFEKKLRKTLEKYPFSEKTKEAMITDGLALDERYEELHKVKVKNE